MSTDVADYPTETVKGRRLRFSLLTAFLLITLVSIVLGYAFRTRYCHATALFRVSSQRSSLWGGDAGRFDAREFEILQRTQLELLKSYFVLQVAVRNPAIASLPIFAGKADPVEWLTEHIEGKFPGNGEILAIHLRANRVYANDVQMVVDAVAKAYENEVLYAEKNGRLVRRDAMARSLGRLNDNLRIKLRDLHKLKTEKGSDPVDLDLQRQEVNNLADLVREFERRVDIEDINADAPESSARIQKIQPAIVTFE